MPDIRKIILIGAGGHARVVCDVVELRGHEIAGYVDPNESSDIHAPRIEEDKLEDALGAADYFISIGGQANEILSRRLDLYDQCARTSQSPALIHPSAQVSKTAKIGAGALVGAGAIVQPNAVVGECAIINSGAIIEHDCVIGRGTHIAPGAIVLGGARIGDVSMIGAGAVILAGVTLPDGSFVKALERQK